MFVLLCFCVLFCALLVILSLLLVIMGGQYDGLFLSGSPPILYIYIHMFIFLMANKLCCCCCCEDGGLDSSYSINFITKEMSRSSCCLSLSPTSDYVAGEGCSPWTLFAETPQIPQSSSVGSAISSLSFSRYIRIMSVAVHLI